jgi:hypothetical protein
VQAAAAQQPPPPPAASAAIAAAATRDGVAGPTPVSVAVGHCSTAGAGHQGALQQLSRSLNAEQARLLEFFLQNFSATGTLAEGAMMGVNAAAAASAAAKATELEASAVPNGGGASSDDERFSAEAAAAEVAATKGAETLAMLSIVRDSEGAVAATDNASAGVLGRGQVSIVRQHGNFQRFNDLGAAALVLASGTRSDLSQLLGEGLLSSHLIGAESRRGVEKDAPSVLALDAKTSNHSASTGVEPADLVSKGDGGKDCTEQAPPVRDDHAEREAIKARLLAAYPNHPSAPSADASFWSSAPLDSLEDFFYGWMAETEDPAEDSPDGGAPACAGNGAVENAGEKGGVDISQETETAVEPWKCLEATSLGFLEDLKKLVPLASDRADPAAVGGSHLSEFIASEIRAICPTLLTEDDDRQLHSFCEDLHSKMVAGWGSELTCLTLEQLKHLARGNCVDAEVADLIMGLICSWMGADYLSSDGRLHPADGPGLKTGGHSGSTDQMPAAGKVLVLACTYWAQVANGEPKFVSNWVEKKTLAQYSKVIWPSAENRHFTLVRMALTRRQESPDGSHGTVFEVEVHLADSNCSSAPAIDQQHLSSLENASKLLFPGAGFKQVAGVKLPQQDSFNDCCFHCAHSLANSINPYRGESGELRLRPHPKHWQRDAARLRSYALFIFYSQMCKNGANLQDLCAAYSTWTQQTIVQPGSKRQKMMETTGKLGDNLTTTSSVDLTLVPEPPANSAKHKKTANMLAGELYKTFVPLASGDAGQAAHPSKTLRSRFCNFIASDIETMLPGVLSQTPILNRSSSMEGENLLLHNADDKLYAFCAQLHTTMMQKWTSTNTCLTREHLQNLARGSCVHEEIADLLMCVLCGVLGASYLDSSCEIHQGSKGRWSGHLKIDEHFSAKTLVLACTFSAQVEAGDPRFVAKFVREQTLAPFSSVLWLKAGALHFTTVRMDLKNIHGPVTTTKTVEVQLADSNCAETPALDTKFRHELEVVSKRLFPDAEFKEGKGIILPCQNSFNDCLFHAALYQAHVISPEMEEGTMIKLRPHPCDWQRDAARLRSYFLFLVYSEMKYKGAALPDLSIAYAEWNGRYGAVREVCSATLRSAHMKRCRLCVVQPRYWVAYKNFEKGVEFRSPRHPTPFFPGMILLFSLNTCERRKGRFGKDGNGPVEHGKNGALHVHRVLARKH